MPRVGFGTIRWWNRLSIRVSALVALVTIGVLGAFVLVSVRVQR